MPYIIYTAIATLVSLASLVGFYNYFPMDRIDLLQNEIGTTLTTINGSDKLSDSRAVINANFTALNSGKIEVSSSSIAAITTLSNLSTVGTIGSGIWRGTAVQAAYGGTGSTTLASNLVMLGNGTTGLKTVSGFGTAGMALVSNGASAAPSWSSVAINMSDYNVWLVGQTFNASTTIAASNLTDATLRINGNNYQWPTTQTASTSLTTDGAGKLYWSLNNRLIQTTTANVTISNTNSSTTLMTVSVPANSLGIRRIIHYKLHFVNFRMADPTRRCDFAVNYGTQNPVYVKVTDPAADSATEGYIEGYIYGGGTTSSQEHNLYGVGTYEADLLQATTVASWSWMHLQGQGSSTVDSTSAQTLTLVARFPTASTNNTLTITNSFIELIGY